MLWLERPRSARMSSARAVILGVKPWRSARLDDAARCDEADHALTVPPPRLEQLEHAVVIGSRARQGVADVVGEMVVADAHGVGVAE